MSTSDYLLLSLNAQYIAEVIHIPTAEIRNTPSVVALPKNAFDIRFVRDGESVWPAQAAALKPALARATATGGTALLTSTNPDGQ